MNKAVVYHGLVFLSTHICPTPPVSNVHLHRIFTLCTLQTFRNFFQTLMSHKDFSSTNSRMASMLFQICRRYYLKHNPILISLGYSVVLKIINRKLILFYLSLLTMFFCIQRPRSIYVRSIIHRFEICIRFAIANHSPSYAFAIPILFKRPSHHAYFNSHSNCQIFVALYEFTTFAVHIINAFKNICVYSFHHHVLVPLKKETTQTITTDILTAAIYSLLNLSYQNASKEHISSRLSQLKPKTQESKWIASIHTHEH